MGSFCALPGFWSTIKLSDYDVEPSDLRQSLLASRVLVASRRGSLFVERCDRRTHRKHRRVKAHKLDRELMLWNNKTVVVSVQPYLPELMQLIRPTNILINYPPIKI